MGARETLAMHSSCFAVEITVDLKSMYGQVPRQVDDNDGGKASVAVCGHCEPQRRQRPSTPRIFSMLCVVGGPTIFMRKLLRITLNKMLESNQSTASSAAA